MSDYNWTSLDGLMQPRGIAVIGASPDASKYPGKVIKNLGRSGFAGQVYPVNPKYDEIFGYKAYKSVRDLPGPADVALLLVGARNIPALLDELIAIGTRTAVVYASGMAEASEAGAKLQQAIAEKAAAGGVRLLGPNCLGCINRDNGTWLSGAAVLGREFLIAGGLSMVTQSGGIMGSFLDRAMAHGIGFAKAIATGNEADINVADCLGYFAQDSATRAIAVFAESIRDIPKFSAACRLAADNGKPVVLMKTGASERGKRVTQGHTAALTGNDAAYDALFDHLGVIRVSALDDLFLIPNVIMNLPLPQGNRVAVISASGGLAGLAADLCDHIGMTMAEFSDATHAEVSGLQAGYGGSYNPLDITGQVVSSDTWWQVRHMHELLLKDPNVDLVISGQAAGQYAEQTGIDLVEMAKAAGKPLVPFWTGREVNATGLSRLRAASLPVFEQAEAAIRAVKATVDFAAFLRDRAVDGPDRPVDGVRAAALEASDDRLGAAIRLHSLPAVQSPVGIASAALVRVVLTIDDQVGPFLTLTGPNGVTAHFLPQGGTARLKRKVANFMLRSFGAAVVSGVEVTVFRLADAFAALAIEGAGPMSATLAFDPEGRIVGADYAVLA